MTISHAGPAAIETIIAIQPPKNVSSMTRPSSAIARTMNAPNANALARDDSTTDISATRRRRSARYVANTYTLNSNRAIATAIAKYAVPDTVASTVSIQRALLCSRGLPRYHHPLWAGCTSPGSRTPAAEAHRCVGCLPNLPKVPHDGSKVYRGIVGEIQPPGFPPGLGDVGHVRGRGGRMMAAEGCWARASRRRLARAQRPSPTGTFVPRPGT